MSGVVPFLDLAALHEPDMDAFMAAVEAVAMRGDFIGGAAVDEFEKAWAQYCTSRHAIGVGNGTDAILLILQGLEIGRGSEVILPANTFVATAEAVLAAGATPVFVDVDDDTLLMTPEIVDRAIRPATRAIIAVHLFGQTPDMTGLNALAATHGVALIEDAAQAHGATWNGARSGSLADAAAFSFYPGKNLGAWGDAGAVTTDDGALAARIRSIANHGRCSAEKYQHDLVGMNSRMDTLQAVVLQIKLAGLDRGNARRRAAAARYGELLASAPIQCVSEAPLAQCAWHLYPVRVANRDLVQKELRESGIATGIHYPVPCHELSPYEHFAAGSLPVVEAAAPRLLSLPMGPTITLDEVECVCAALLESSAVR